MTTRREVYFVAAILFVVAALQITPVRAADTHRLLNLRGHWKFNLGDSAAWCDPKFDDEDWSEIYVPSQWEEEGYPGYDGYAWYRKHFRASSSWGGEDLQLELGFIDDVDEVYLNGKLVGGTGSFPPEYESAYNIERRYSISAGLLKGDGDNVIAVRVYDDHGGGGIVDGRVGIYELKYYVDPDVYLPKTWKFKTGDNMAWKDPGYSDASWRRIRVPAAWETQGFKGYDGYAWYRVKFSVPDRFEGDRLIMLVGKIDDYDEVYLNGTRIGKTGPMPKYKMSRNNSDDYLHDRAYTIPSGLLRFGAENVLAVRVYDAWQVGGIYEGPLGLVTRQRYRTRNYRHSYRSVENWFENLFDDIFH